MKPLRQQAMGEGRIGVICGLLASIGPISFAIYTPAMPEIAGHFGVSVGEVQLSISLYFAGFAVAQLFCGPLADGLGRKPVLYAFLGLYVLASVQAMLADDIRTLIAARILQGTGAAAGLALSRTIVRDVFDDRRGMVVQSYIGIMLAIGPALAPALGGALANAFGWQAIFAVLALLGTATLGIVLRGLAETGHYDPSRIRPRAILRSYRRIVGTPAFLLPGLVLAGTNGTLYAQSALLAFVMIDGAGYSPMGFGLAMMVQPLSFIAGSIMAPRLLRRYGRGAVAAAGMMLAGCGALSMTLGLLAAGPSFWTVMLPIGIYNLGVSQTMPTMTVAGLSPFQQEAGAAAAMLGFVQMGAGLVGGLVAALFADAVVALAVITPAMTAMAALSWWHWSRLHRNTMT